MSKNTDLNNSQPLSNNTDLDEMFDDILKDETKNIFIVEPQERTVTIDEFELENTKHEAVVPCKKFYNSSEEIASYKNDTFLSLKGFEPTLTHKSYNFELDIFQKLAISAIELDHSVLVAAHTSCGKTVVAEYAIAQSLNNKQRVVYTSPIKALSNQKFRELKEEFEDVGLMTGDVTLNPEATCLVMTTEILRNMLYRNSEVVREIHWIIFDEIHYLKDSERGVVWEETIILLPKHARMVFLSATIPNAREFAEWISYVQKQIVHVVYTEKRVIPLKHYFYSINTADQNRPLIDQRRKSVKRRQKTDMLQESNIMLLVKDEDTFYSENFLKSQEAVIPRKEISTALISLINEISVPAVIFSFSRAACEYFAGKVVIDYLGEEEKELVRTIFHNALQGLSEEDRELEGISSMLGLFERGIGIHHSGLVPVVREISEILFQESLIKVLFATETFSIGLNMPAKSVIFTSIKKFDGVSERLLSSSEYCQMSGRAGRRGLDKEGTVISLVTAQYESKDVVKMVNGLPDPLNSAFYLKYNMILNLMRTEDLDATYFLGRSFYHYQTYKRSLLEQNEIKEIEKQVVIYERKLNKGNIRGNLISDVGNRTHGSKISDSDGSVSSRCAVVDAEITSYSQLYRLMGQREMLLQQRNNKLLELHGGYLHTKHRVVDLMVPRNSFPIFIKKAIVVDYDEESNELKVAYLSNQNEVKIVQQAFPANFIFNIYKNMAKVNERSFYRDYALLVFKSDFDQEIHAIEQELLKAIPDRRFSRGISEKTCVLCGLDACMKDLYEELLGVENEIKSDLYEKVTVSATLSCLKRKYKESEKNINSLRKIYHMKECKKMIEVLKRMNYLEGNRVLLKGKMASEITTTDEILLTEMIFSSSFNSLSLQDTIALISVLITERSKEGDEIVISEENAELIEIIHKNIKTVVKAMNECGIEVTVEEYGRDFHYYMMDIVKLWITGHSFREICSKTKVFEGSIIRSFKRLEELLRQLSSAATVIGNSELANLFGQGIYLIKRDIVFANSLYL
ncbi:hypothetical protein NUSPORA_01118 [Nucleospora cyclopteri]